MTLIKIFVPLLILASCFMKGLNSQQQAMTASQTLDKKQQAIVSISAFTAKGDMASLQKELNEGLDAGLTVNEIKEVLVQLYAYAGFPRSLNALNTFMAVAKERKLKGINDEPGKEAAPLPANKSSVEFGTANQTKLIGRPVSGEVYQFAPAIDQFLKAHLFGDIFGRDNLDWKTRELATIAALAGLGGADAQLRSHFGVGMYNGLTEAQLQQLVSIIQTKLGSKEGKAANDVLQSVLKQKQNLTSTDTIKYDKMNNKEEPNANAIFPKGEKTSAEYFTGIAWLNRLVPKDETGTYSVGNVVFEPGARTNWHTHPAGQILVVLDGKGWYQEKDKPARSITKGDVTIIPSNTVHWHGAAKDSSLTHLAITNSKDGGVKWLQPVTDEEYHSNK